MRRSHFLFLICIIFELTLYFPRVITDFDVDYKRLKNHYPKLKWEYYLPINIYSRENDLTTDQVCAIIDLESNWNPRAISKSGARGLMQIMRCNYRNGNFNDMFIPEMNIKIGCNYFSWCLEYAKGNFDRALQYYNAGPYGKNYNPQYGKIINKNIQITALLKNPVRIR